MVSVRMMKPQALGINKGILLDGLAFVLLTVAGVAVCDAERDGSINIVPLGMLGLRMIAVSASVFTPVGIEAAIHAYVRQSVTAARASCVPSK